MKSAIRRPFLHSYSSSATVNTLHIESNLCMTQNVHVAFSEGLWRFGEKWLQDSKDVLGLICRVKFLGSHTFACHYKTQICCHPCLSILCSDTSKGCGGLRFCVVHICSYWFVSSIVSWAVQACALLVLCIVLICNCRFQITSVVVYWFKFCI